MSAVASARAHAPSALPDILPIFPLTGAVLLPNGRLPLNVFEPRYLAMVDDVLGQGRIIGMIQPTEPETKDNPVPSVYRIGCAGRITSFSESDDGRFLIALTGLCRFSIAEELPLDKPWRRVRPDWSTFLHDLNPPAEDIAIDRPRLIQALEPYFKEEGLQLDWGMVENTPNDVLISALAMICPLEPNEKQALLEAPDLEARASVLTTLLEMACMPKPAEGEGGAKH
ncbi:MAG: LON peptidase substrate-binding domain-containing protein [Alphaproteobacteria bacterium]|nr:LON peptidase substrate-binding domain-containing protein [Alphaproteobacteria bacterium]